MNPRLLDVRRPSIDRQSVRILLLPKPPVTALLVKTIFEGGDNESNSSQN
jgi:hypothetical protein